MSIRRCWCAVVVALAAWRAASAQESAGGGQPTKAPEIQHVDFERHVAPLLSRLGCNAGACHGSFEGQGGFRLSLFGQSAAKDFAALSATGARRVVVDAPDESLMLAKPSRRVDHEGGLRLPADSWQYAVVRRWIANSAHYQPHSGDVRELVIEPQSLLQLAPGNSRQLTVTAEFADGTREDVTAFSELRSSDEAVAGVDADGRLTAAGPGSASVIASYLGSFAQASTMVPFPAAGTPNSRLAPANFIDEEINRQLDDLNLTSSPAATDHEFLRRATLDVLGTLPSVADVREFAANYDADKREQVIDRLLAHPRRAAVWASKMCDITACNVDTMEAPESLRPKRAKMWYDWFRRRFADNMRYDELARGVLCATSRGGEPLERWIKREAERETEQKHAGQASFDSDYADRGELDLYWRRMGPDGPLPVEDLAELTASAFLGLRLHCARCHHHPYDRWSQREFAGFAQILARVEFGSSTELRSEINRQLESRRRLRATGATYTPLPRLREVYVSAKGRPLIDAAAEASAPPAAPSGPIIDGSSDPRQAFADWLVQPENPFFARSFVNRVWAKYFGAGLVEPVDDMSASNPASHPALLTRLTAEFVKSGYDIAKLERLILSSNAYQRSACPSGNNAAYSRGFARAKVRPLPAETLIDALNAALETSDDFGPDVPAGSTAMEVAPNRLSDSRFNTVFRLLGRGDRRSLCDCDRAAGPSIRQPIFLMSDPLVLAKITQGRLARLMAAESNDRAILTELYLATLSRPPGEDELEFLQKQISNAPDRPATLADVLWALLNTREFSTNH